MTKFAVAQLVCMVARACLLARLWQKWLHSYCHQIIRNDWKWL